MEISSGKSGNDTAKRSFVPAPPPRHFSHRALTPTLSQRERENFAPLSRKPEKEDFAPLSRERERGRG